jgi:hypothetical protein
MPDSVLNVLWKKLFYRLSTAIRAEAIRMAFLWFLAGALGSAALGGLAGYGIGSWYGRRYYYPPYAAYGYSPYYAPPIYSSYYPRTYAWNPWTPWYSY